MSQVINEAAILSSDRGSLPLLADIQYLEPYTSSALNRKFRGILRAGIYTGFQPKAGTGLSVMITSSSEHDGQGAASINVGKNQISIQQVKDVIVPVPASKTSIIALEANFEFGKVTNQVDSSSTLKAAHIVVVDVSRGISGNQLELCRVNVPMDAKAITESMIDTSHRLAQTVGITLSEKIDSNEEGIAANPKAVNVLRKTLLGDAPDGLNTIGQLAQAIGGNKNFIESISTALLEKMSKSANGADIPDKNAFINNLGLRDTVNKADNTYNKAETDSRVNDAKTAANNANSNANGRVPDGRKVNGKALTNDIVLNAGDVGAYSRAETDSRVNEAKTLANNTVSGMRLSAFRNQSVSRKSYLVATGESTYINQFGWAMEHGDDEHADDYKYLGYPIRRSGEITIKMNFSSDRSWDSTSYATIQYLINGNWVNIADEPYN
ncbi:hypothetical protein [Xenorhabdus bovienii]|uniref:hypothetical protein n=1 Tax=Xenorhabdus bovienii TaxID=40576 RepID=UPI00237CB867|nr:hypothetical protein [Xenorhabdus bovienii]